jgi:hypothetical protein
MNDYTIALFLHIVGSLGIFMMIGFEWTGLWQIRGAMIPEQVREWMGILKSIRRVGFTAMLITVVSGLYMAATDWGGVAWIYVSIGALVLVIILSGALTGPRMAVIGQALASKRTPGSPIFHNLANNPLLWISIQTRVAIALGVVFLKIAKPNLAGSLLTIGVAIALGLVSALPIPRRERVQEGSAD